MDEKFLGDITIKSNMLGLVKVLYALFGVTTPFPSRIRPEAITWDNVDKSKFTAGLVGKWLGYNVYLELKEGGDE